MQATRTWLIRWPSGAWAKVKAVDYFAAREKAAIIAPKIMPWAIVLQD